MLTTQDVIELARVRLTSLAVSKNEHVLIQFVNLGLVELYRRFDLLFKTEVVPLLIPEEQSDGSVKMVVPNNGIYTLQNTDVNMLLWLFDEEGKKVSQAEIYQSDKGGYKQLNYNSFILTEKFPREGSLTAFYRASPPRVQNVEEPLHIPDVMVEALVHFIAYMGNTTINKDNGAEVTLSKQMFEGACADLVNKGYQNSLDVEPVSLLSKGYV